MGDKEIGEKKRGRKGKREEEKEGEGRGRRERAWRGGERKITKRS